MFWYIARILFPTVHAPIFSSLVSYFLIFMSNYAAGYPVNRVLSGEWQYHQQVQHWF